VQGDIADRATAERVIAAGMERFGRIDTLVNNAGIFLSKEFTDFTEADYDAVLGVNVAGFFRISQLAVEQMLRQGGGHIVQITTSLVEHPNSNVPSLLASLSKGGLQAATKALAIEYASRNIRSNAVALGTIKTPMHPEEHHETLAGLHPVGRMGEISDIADAVIYLENAPFVTGAILPVDGGQTAGH
jgi:NAD(P)-dependent dehydrogenase (short-subunit alcohol dehydrogenase family)